MIHEFNTKECLGVWWVMRPVGDRHCHEKADLGEIGEGRKRAAVNRNIGNW